MSVGEDRLARAIDRAEDDPNDGFEDEDGTWIEPQSVQREIILEWFRMATGDNSFDVFGTVNERATVMDGEPLRDNLRRVCASFANQTKDAEDIIDRQLRDYPCLEDGCDGTIREAPPEADSTWMCPECGTEWG